MASSSSVVDYNKSYRKMLIISNISHTQILPSKLMFLDIEIHTKIQVYHFALVQCRSRPLFTEKSVQFPPFPPPPPEVYSHFVLTKPGFDRGVWLKPQNLCPFVRVILAE